MLELTDKDKLGIIAGIERALVRDCDARLKGEWTPAKPGTRIDFTGEWTESDKNWLTRTFEHYKLRISFNGQMEVYPS